MGLVRVTAYRRMNGETLYYFNARMTIMSKPTYISRMDPVAVMQLYHQHFPKRPYQWCVSVAPDRVSMNKKWTLTGVRLLRTDKFVGPMRPEDTYDLETAVDIWAAYVRMLGPPKERTP